MLTISAVFFESLSKKLICLTAELHSSFSIYLFFKSLEEVSSLK